MKYVKSFLIYGFIINLFTYIYDSHTLSSLLFHYSSFNLGYLIFVAIQIFWTSLLFQILYHSIILANFIHIRMNIQNYFFIILKQLCFYTLFYIFTHILFFTLFHQSLDYSLMMINLIIQIISFLCVIIIRNTDYSYILLICFLIIIHLLL